MLVSSSLRDHRLGRRVAVTLPRGVLQTAAFRERESFHGGRDIQS